MDQVNRRKLRIGSEANRNVRRCDGHSPLGEHGLPAYQESSNPRNIPLYARYGFEVIGEVRPDDFPRVYPMLRPAR